MRRIIFLGIFFTFTYINISAQCFLDRHNTSWLDQWISCNTSMNPNPARGESHWILYDLNYPYELFQMHIWNVNAPEYLTSGVQDIVIDISNDGINWSQVGEFQIPMADGTPTYEGLDLFDFEGTSAQYVLITGLTNHGGDCFGLSEIRINVAEFVVDTDEEPITSDCLSATIFPNPISEASKAIINAPCSNTTIYYSIQDITGKTVKSGAINPVSDQTELDLNALPIVSGTYFLSLQQLDLVKRFKMVKAE